MTKSFAFFLLSFAVVALFVHNIGAQTAATADYANMRCNLGTAGTPYLLWTGKVGYPACIAIGPTLRTSFSNGHDTLDAIASATPAARTQVALTQNADGTYTVPANAVSPMVYRNGLYQTPGLDYTLAAAGSLAPGAAAAWAVDDVVSVVF